jgi:hypothetical protein
MAREGADIRAVAKYDRAVSHGSDFAQSVRDIDHADALRAQRCHDLVQP